MGSRGASASKKSQTPLGGYEASLSNAVVLDFTMSVADFLHIPCHSFVWGQSDLQGVH